MRFFWQEGKKLKYFVFLRGKFSKPRCGRPNPTRLISKKFDPDPSLLLSCQIVNTRIKNGVWFMWRILIIVASTLACALFAMVRKFAVSLFAEEFSICRCWFHLWSLFLLSFFLVIAITICQWWWYKGSQPICFHFG